MATVREFHDKAMELAHKSLIAKHQPDVEQLHDKAMELADESDLAKIKGNPESANDFAMMACDYEEKAAALVSAIPENEPTRGILYRSAASLAYWYKDYPRALRLIKEGLSGFPAGEIAEEMIELREEIEREGVSDVEP